MTNFPCSAPKSKLGKRQDGVSKSEYNNCTLPRLVTRIGDPEKEMKEFEKEAKIEKEKEEKLEREIRELRKERNRARLITEKNQRPK